MRKFKEICNRLFCPVPIFAFGLFPIIIKGTSVVNALLLGLVFVISAFTITALSLLLPRLLSKTLLTAAYAAAAALAVCLVGFIFTKLSLFDMNTLGAVLPLAAVDPLITAALVRQNSGKSAKSSFISAAVYSACFLLLTFAVSAVREFLYTGSIFGITVLSEWHRVFSAALPFFGMIMLAFIAAGVRFVSDKLGRCDREEGAEQ